MLTLKAKDSESSENEPIIETDIFQSDADPSDSPYSQEYFDLMDMIDNTGKQIEYYKMVYTAEIDGLAKRRHSLKTHFLYNVVFLICLIIFDSLFSNIMLSGGGVVMQTYEGWENILQPAVSDTRDGQHMVVLQMQMRIHIDVEMLH